MTDEELDLAMREADVAIRLRIPTQPDLIQRKLFSVHFHAYASPEYLKRFGTPTKIDDLDSHRIILLGGGNIPTFLQNRNWPLEVGREGKAPRAPMLVVNNILSLLRLRAGSRYRITAGLPDREKGGLVQLLSQADTITLDAYFVYPEELKSVARVQVFAETFWCRRRSAGPIEVTTASLIALRRFHRRHLSRGARGALHAHAKTCGSCMAA